MIVCPVQFASTGIVFGLVALRWVGGCGYSLDER